MSQRTLLVTGASGQLGQKVLESLRGSDDVVLAGTRHPDRLPSSRLVDFDRPETLDRAFAGVDRLLLISTDKLDVPGARKKQQLAAVEAAKRAGVAHVVYTSIPNPVGNLVTAVAPDHEATEEAIVASGIEHTFLRNNMYLDLFVGGFAHAVATGALYAAAGDGKVGFVTREDCARVAAAALAASEPGSRTFDVNGPQSRGYADVAAILSEVTGKKVQYVATTPAQQKEGLVAAGVPPLMADVLVQFDRAAAAGQLDTRSDAIQQLTGHAPTSVKAFLTAHRAQLVG